MSYLPFIYRYGHPDLQRSAATSFIVAKSEEHNLSLDLQLIQARQPGSLITVAVGRLTHVEQDLLILEST